MPLVFIGFDGVLAQICQKCIKTKDGFQTYLVGSDRFMVFFSGDELVNIYFKGNSPILQNSVFTGVSENAIVYYKPETYGWSDTYGGLPTLKWFHNYDEWIALYPGSSSDVGFAADPDGDGQPNGLENFYGTNPYVNSSGIEPINVNGNTFTFEHPQRINPATDLTVSYEWTSDLDAFYADGASNSAGTTTVTFITTPDTPTTGITTLTATVTGSVLPEQLYVRMAVDQVM